MSNNTDIRLSKEYTIFKADLLKLFSLISLFRIVKDYNDVYISSADARFKLKDGKASLSHKLVGSVVLDLTDRKDIDFGMAFLKLEFLLTDKFIEQTSKIG